MSAKQTELSYRRAAIENASSVGLIVILYDLLVDDLRQAIREIENKNVDGRSKALKHAFLVLQQLEGSLDFENGGEAAKNLSKFYAVMRARIFEAQLKVSAPILTEQIGLVLDVRKAWEQVDPAKAVTAAPVVAQPVQGEGEAGNASWTA